MSTINLPNPLMSVGSENGITNPIDWNDGITGHAMEMITQGNGWYLQLRAGVEVLEKSTVLNLEHCMIFKLEKKPSIQHDASVVEFDIAPQINSRIVFSICL